MNSVMWDVVLWRCVGGVRRMGGHICEKKHPYRDVCVVIVYADMTPIVPPSVYLLESLEFFHGAKLAHKITQKTNK